MPKTHTQEETNTRILMENGGKRTISAIQFRINS